ncbi:MAG: hypothetical protein GTN36_00085 [Candidatus Aenigmarchaeota archaeon]|nr:hypothetical protein [Candidatus Aenigmarchaeota archaeon]
MNQIINCPKGKTLVDISECTFCECFNKNKSKFCRFRLNSCDYYFEEGIIKLIMINEEKVSELNAK